MNTLRQALADYLAVRRVLGYKLARAEKLLAQFLDYIEDRGEDHITIEAALAWATLPPGSIRAGQPPDFPSFAALRFICTGSTPQPRCRRRTCWRGGTAGPRPTSIPKRTSPP
jgi:hypothetical protein